MAVSLAIPFALLYAGVPLGSYLRCAFSEMAAWARSAPQGDIVVPGVVIDYSPASSGQYIGSPGITILPNGEYLAKYDLFGLEQPKPRFTRMFISKDVGEALTLRSTVRGVAWASIFVHRGDVYMMGTNKRYVKVIIVRSHFFSSVKNAFNFWCAKVRFTQSFSWGKLRRRTSNCVCFKGALV